MISNSIHVFVVAGLFDWLSDAAKSVASGFLAIVGRLLSSFFSFLNDFACTLIDIAALIFPSTPPSLKIGALLDSIGGTIPFLGRGLVYEIAGTVGTMFFVVVVIKGYKLIPFKST